MSQTSYAPAAPLAADIQELCGLITHSRDRIEIPTAEHGTLVLLTKTELDHLESALALMADSDHMCAVCEHISKVCDRCNTTSAQA